MELLLLALCAIAGVSALNIKVASTGGNATSSYAYGVMFEDINQSGDGGIYAELIRNRAFQGSTVHPSVVEPWTGIGGAALSLKNLSDPLSSALPTSLNVAASSGQVGISNPGYWGIEVKSQKYTGSFWVKGNFKGSFTASLFNYLSNATLGSVQVPSNASSSEWREHKFILTPDTDASNINNTFRITYNASATDGSLDFSLISLFPPTYKNRPNGMRIDLMEALKGLSPSFLRFPGGNNLEGDDPPYYWKWNETIGPLKDRPGFPGTWNYQNTNGLGLIEYLHWCEDLEMEPVLAVWAGFYLNGPVINETDLQPYVDDALNELEFLMGDTSTTYGALRASLGYPEPWKIRYVEVGNEDNLNVGGASYEAYRFQAFRDAINKKYPEIFVFASTVNYNFEETQDVGADYHQYARPDRFVGQFNFFDHFTPGHKTMIGEYAAVQWNVPEGGSVNWTAPFWPFPQWIGAVSEAVFLLGAERNADKIWGAAYAPTLQNMNNHQWTPDLISFTANAEENVLSTSYKMIELFSAHRISEVLPMASPVFGPAYYVAGYSESTDSYIVKAAVYNSTQPVDVTVAFEGVSKGAKGTLKVLTAPEATSINSVKSNVVKTSTTSLTAGSDGVFSFVLPNLSVSVLEIKG